MRLEHAETLTRLPLMRNVTEHQPCPVHGPRALVLDLRDWTWFLTCVGGPFDDVPSPRPCPHIGVSPEGIEILSDSDEGDDELDPQDISAELLELERVARQYDVELDPQDISDELHELGDIARQYE